MRIVLLGAPGSGKGTQAKMMAEAYRVPQISTGDILRKAVADKTEVGKKVAAMMDAGELVSDRIVIDAVTDQLRSSDSRRGFVLDGFPRTLAQGSALDQFLAESHRPAATAVYLDVPMDILEERVAHRVGCDPCGNVWPRETAPVACPECGNAVVPRNDDSIDLYRSRLAEYEKKTLPLLPYYEDGDRLRRISGQGSPDDVFARVLDALAS